MSKDDNFKNRRKYNRVKLDDPIKVFSEPDSSKDYFGDLSKNGLMFISKEDFTVNKVIEVSLKYSNEEYMRLKVLVKRCLPKILEETIENNSNSYVCFSCDYKALKTNDKDHVKWSTINNEKTIGIFDFIQKDLENIGKICPNCREDGFYPWEGQNFEVGCEFAKLEYEEKVKIEEIILNTAKNIGKSIDLGFIPTYAVKEYTDPFNLFSAYLTSISGGTLNFNLENELNLGEVLTIGIGLQNSDKFPLECKVIKKKKLKNTSFSYRGKVYNFHKGTQRNLMDFIHGLSVDPSY